MASQNFIANLDQNLPVFVGMDVHKNKWSICIIHHDEVIEKHTIPGEYSALKPILDKYKNFKINSVYEAGFSGFYLHYYLVEDGINNILVSVSKIPTEVGNLVKTDRKDAHKLAFCLSKGLLRGIHVPSKDQIDMRQIIRTREKIIRAKRTVITRIKMLLLQFDVKLESRGLTREVITNIRSKPLPIYLKESIEIYLDQFDLLHKQANRCESKARVVAMQSQYSETFKILTTIPGIGPIIASALCFEIGDFKRFSSADKLASYIGLTPREFSSGEHVYKGRITGQGSTWLRSYLVEASWFVIGKDPALKSFYNRVKNNSGSGKKAIVAVARKLLHRMHSIVINNQSYAIGEIG
jgi:transposase